MCNTHHSIPLGREAVDGSLALDPGSVERDPVDEAAAAGAAPDSHAADDDELLATVGEVRRDG